MPQIYHPDKLPPLPEPSERGDEFADKWGYTHYNYHFSADQMRAYAAAAVADLEAQVKQLQDTLALQKRSYEREIELDVAAERERCAKLCEEVAKQEVGDAYAGIALDCAAAIRAGDTAP